MPTTTTGKISLAFVALATVVAAYGLGNANGFNEGQTSGAICEANARELVAGEDQQAPATVKARVAHRNKCLGQKPLVRF
ncbi:MAG: hypothetical protein KGQ41_09315 [Alphaproteobacteria bacterium]|nr:hypothetical protein [Alphaproteobacteria bacterium]